MNKLFIIGNGFDLAHGLKTSYKNFHKYIRETYFDEEFKSDEEFENCEFYNEANIPEFSIGNRGEEVCEDTKVLSFLGNVLSNVENGNNWSDLETSLGKLDFGNHLDEYGFDDEEDDDNYERDKMFRTEDNVSNICIATPRISEFFTEWVNTIKIKDISPNIKFKKLVDMNRDLFLTFNYTSTLEEVYGAKNILHIHGKCGEKLLFGHGEEFDFDYYEKNYFGSEFELSKLHETLRKNTSQAIKDNINFFRSLSDVEEIYSFGFSFSNVDKVYIEEIIKNLNKNVTWYLHDFGDDDTKNRYCNVIKSCGFKGSLDFYKV